MKHGYINASDIVLCTYYKQYFCNLSSPNEDFPNLIIDLILFDFTISFEIAFHCPRHCDISNIYCHDLFPYRSDNV